jgi:hypothetical protein
LPQHQKRQWKSIKLGSKINGKWSGGGHGTPTKTHTTNKKYLKQREPKRKMSRKPKYENNYNQEVN